MQRYQAFFVARCLCHRPPWLKPWEVNGVQRLQDFGAHVLLSNLQITWKLATGVKESATKRSRQNHSKNRSLIVSLGSCHFLAWKSECLLSILEILSKDPCHPKSRMITPLRTNMKPENHPIETETHLESEPENLHFLPPFLWFSQLKSPPFFVTNGVAQGDKLETTFGGSSQIIEKKESGAAASRKIKTQTKMDDNVIMSVHLILHVYIMMT